MSSPNTNNYQPSNSPENVEHQNLLNRLGTKIAQTLSPRIQAGLEARADTLERRQQLADYASEVAMERISDKEPGDYDRTVPLPDDLSRREAKQLLAAERGTSKQLRNVANIEWEQKVIGGSGHYSRRETRKMRRQVEQEAIEDLRSGRIDADEANKRISGAKANSVYVRHEQHKLQEKAERTKEQAIRQAEALAPSKIDMRLAGLRQTAGVDATPRPTPIRITPVRPTEEDNPNREEEDDQQHPRFEEAKHVIAQTQEANTAVLLHVLDIPVKEGRKILKQMERAGHITPSTAGPGYAPTVNLPKPAKERKDARRQSPTREPSNNSSYEVEPARLEAFLINLDDSVEDEIRLRAESWGAIDKAEFRERAREVREELYRDAFDNPDMSPEEVEQTFRQIKALNRSKKSQ